MLNWPVRNYVHASIDMHHCEQLVLTSMETMKLATCVCVSILIGPILVGWNKLQQQINELGPLETAAHNLEHKTY